MKPMSDTVETPIEEPTVTVEVLPEPPKAPEPIKKEFKTAKKIQETPKEPIVNTVDKVVPPDDFEKSIKKIQDSGTLEEKLIVDKMNAYIVDMAEGKPISFEKAARLQYGLWSTILATIEKCPEDQFKSRWSLILKYFDRYSERGQPLNSIMVYRYSEYWTKGAKELEVFQRLLNLIVLTCKPANRKSALRQVSMEKTLKDMITETGRQKIIQFYDY